VKSKLWVFPCLALLLLACSNQDSQSSPPIEAIDRVRLLAGLTRSDLTFVETTTMINSPSGDLRVDLYRDEEGRQFYVEPITNIVVEMDARSLLGIAHQSDGFTQSKTQLEEKVRQFVQGVIPGFASVENSLRYESREKEGIFFFDWREENIEGAFMPRFIQVGMTSYGDMFAFYNTVSIR